MMHKGRGVAAETWIVVRLAGASPRTQKVRLWSLDHVWNRHGVRPRIVGINGLSRAVMVAMMTMCTSAAIRADETVPIPAAELLSHFPDRAHAVVWRNWQAVEPERIATVLGTSVDNIHDMARSMGLPPATAIRPEQKTRGYFYMSLCRRNWHLLPLDQLATLLDTTPDQLLHFLQVEEMANWIILGGFKPECEPVRYEEPGDAVRHRAAHIRQIVAECFGDEIRLTGEPRFAFVDRLSELRTDLAPPDSSVQRLFAPRFLCSYLKIYGDPLSDPQVDMYPEGLLQRLAEVGVDGVWLYGVLRELAPGGPQFPEFGKGHEARLANLRTLVARAGKYGMGVYLYINEPRAMSPEFFANRAEMRGVGDGLCTSHPAVRQWLSDGLAHVFRAVPGLAGVFTITASENQTNCAWAGPETQARCPRCRARASAEIIADVNAAIAAGVHRSNPEARVIVWDWGWPCSARDVIARLPKSVWLMSVSEWAQPIERGGIQSAVGEYSVSVVGPGPRASQHWAWAKEAGLKTVAKVQLNTSWELASLPYLPVLDLVAQHCRNLTETGVDGMMLTWSLGGYPSPNLQLAERFSRLPTPSVEEALDAVAQERFGPAATAHARRAWTAFSRAFEQYPYSGSVLYYGPLQLGPANLLYGRRTGWRTTMVGFPYDDLERWCPPYPPAVFASQLETMADLWQQGVDALQAAVEQASADKRPLAEAELRYARAALLYFQSAANQVRFILQRDALPGTAETVDSRRQRLDQLREILQRESAVARDMYTLARQDSCIGFEGASQYFYLPLDLVEKVFSCRLLEEALR